MGSRFWASKPRLFWIAFVTVLMGYFAIYGGIETTKAFQTLESSKVLNQSGTQFLVGIPLSVEVGSNYSIRLEVKDSGDPAVIRGRVDFYADSSLVASRNWSWSEYGDEDDPFPQVSQIVQFVYDCTNPVTNFTIALAIEAG
nr:hypothetical protein [Candidatus Sigynarchaeota archaeon]